MRSFAVPFFALASFTLAACSGGYYAFPDGGGPSLDGGASDGPTVLPDGGAADVVISTDSGTADVKKGGAPVILNEIAPNVSGGADLIELRALEAGSLAGFTLEQDVTAPMLLATLPAINVAAGDLIVVHLASSSGIQSESSSKSSCASSTCYPNAWDVFNGTSGITFSGRVIVLRNASKAIVDGAPFYRSGLASGAGFAGELSALQKAGHWLPATCNGNPCTTNELAEPIAVDWLGVGSSPTGATVARKGGTDSDQSADWAIGANTLGAPN